MTPGKSRKISYRKGLIQTIRHRGAVLCHLCWKEITHPGDLTVDHIIPLSVGGDNVAENWQPAHERCNQQKGNRVLPELTPWIKSAPPVSNVGDELESDS